MQLGHAKNVGNVFISDRFNLFVCTVTVSSYLVLLYTLVLIFKTAQKSYIYTKQRRTAKHCICQQGSL